MEMQMDFVRKLPTPIEIKEQYPVDDSIRKMKEERDEEIAKIFSGKEDKFVLIIGPCSADNEDSVCEYMSRLAEVAEKVKDKIFMIPRCYTGKPRTVGIGYKGMLHQPDPDKPEDMLAGIIAIRDISTRRTSSPCSSGISSFRKRAICHRTSMIWWTFRASRPCSCVTSRSRKRAICHRTSLIWWTFRASRHRRNISIMC